MSNNRKKSFNNKYNQNGLSVFDFGYRKGSAGLGDLQNLPKNIDNVFLCASTYVVKEKQIEYFY